MKKLVLPLILTVITLGGFSHGFEYTAYAQASQSRSKPVLKPSFYDDIVYQKVFKLGGKNYVLYFNDPAKSIRPSDSFVIYVYLVPEDYVYREGTWGIDLNSPPMMINFTYHDLGDPDKKDYSTALFRERISEDHYANEHYVDYELYLSKEIAEEIIDLLNADSKFKPGPSLSHGFVSIKEDDSLIDAKKVPGTKVKRTMEQDFILMVHFKKQFKMEGKTYTMYYSDEDPNKHLRYTDEERKTRRDKKLVTNIYLVPEDYDYKMDIDGNDLNTPPQMVKFIYHDLGDENKNYCTAVLKDKRGDDARNLKEYKREVRLPDEIATDIIHLLGGETEFRIVDSMIDIYSEVKETPSSSSTAASGSTSNYSSSSSRSSSGSRYRYSGGRTRSYSKPWFTIGIDGSLDYFVSDTKQTTYYDPYYGEYYTDYAEGEDKMAYGVGLRARIGRMDQMFNLISGARYMFGDMKGVQVPVLLNWNLLRGEEMNLYIGGGYEFGITDMYKGIGSAMAQFGIGIPHFDVQMYYKPSQTVLGVGLTIYL